MSMPGTLSITSIHEMSSRRICGLVSLMYCSISGISFSTSKDCVSVTISFSSLSSRDAPWREGSACSGNAGYLFHLNIHIGIQLTQAAEDLVDKRQNAASCRLHNVVQRLASIEANARILVVETIENGRKEEGNVVYDVRSNADTA